MAAHVLQDGKSASARASRPHSCLREGLANGQMMCDLFAAACASISCWER